MNSNKARVISNWKPTNERESAALKEFLMQEMGAKTAHHEGGTGKLGPDSGRLIR
ncbi:MULTISPECIES: hypothetical protein [Photobacterium]|uniref:Uncharacterized protein n=1 Tax=Photobacterium pectinilyticum TaxID=2906793 RepID=A0ABT1N4V3_9GAMM|nr:MULTISPECIES: hypothetical protein [Photobacterium]MCQ1059768.1 hypothetical protein [Photobacterium sp. ZSDE20]MDD1826003.1 hypothetical protein [Photobacterium sp. ZSDE20]TDR78803.1 hypothetical protein DFP78_101316 [Photobacterium lutimaris]